MSGWEAKMGDGFSGVPWMRVIGDDGGVVVVVVDADEWRFVNSLRRACDLGEDGERVRARI